MISVHQHIKIIASLVLIATASCSKGTRVMSMKLDSVGNDRAIAEGATDQGATGAAESDYRGNQLLQAPASSEIAGAGTLFPMGSLSISATIGLNKGGSSVATAGVISGLGLDTAVSSSGVPVVVSSSPAQDTRSPFILSIPLPKSSGLALSEQQLVVFFEQYIASTGKYLVGILAAGDVTKDGSVVKVNVKSFGTYQAAYLTKSISGSASKAGQAVDFTPPISSEPPTILSVTSLSPDGLYAAGHSVSIQVKFSKAVTVVGAPALKLSLSNRTADAAYTSGSGSSMLVFTYEVDAADVASRLDYLSASPFNLGSAKITDTDGNQATLTVPAPGASGSLSITANLQVNGAAVSAVDVSSSHANGAFKVSETITIDVTFSGAVTVTGTPRLKLATGGTPAYATYSGGSTSVTLSFAYTVTANDNSSDLDYDSVSALELSGGTITDASGNSVATTLPTPGDAGSLGANKNIVIDTVSPIVPVLSVGSRTFSSGFSTNVSQGATSDANFKEFRYLFGAGTLDCTTGTASSSQPSSILISVTSTLRVITCDLAGNVSSEATATYTLDSTAPTVSDVSSTTTNGAYKVGDTIAITVTFNEDVVVTGTPTLLLATTPTNRHASYSPGVGPTLTFEYVVQSTDTSSDLTYVATSSLTLPGGATIKDTAGNDATLTLAGPSASGSLGFNKDLKIDTTAPLIPVISLSSTTFDATISPSISQNATSDANFKEFRYVLTAAATLNCTSGTASTTLPTTIAIAATSTLRVITCDLAGNMSSEASETYTLSTAGPVVQSVSSTNVDGTYKAGDMIAITVTFDEAIAVTGSPKLLLETGTTDREAVYASASGTVATFHYTVQSGDVAADLNYQSTGALSLNSGTIADMFLNAATLTLPDLTGGSSLAARNIVIDGVAPTVSSVTASSGTVYPGSYVDIVVTFNESLTWGGGGSPTLTLATSPTARTAILNSITATTLTFRYTVAVGDSAGDLDYVATTSLTLGGKTLKDAAGNDAVLTLPSPGNAGSLSQTSAVVVMPVITPVITPSGTPILPAQSGLTTMPTAVFSVNITVDNIQLYRDSTCTTTYGGPTGTKTGGTQLSITPTTAGLPTSGTHTIAAKAVKAGTYSTCTTIGTYTTGVNKVVVATNSANAGESWACAIVNGGLKCWGSNVSGQLGDGTIADRSIPTQVYAANSDVTDVALNADSASSLMNSTCVVKAGSVYCWGDNSEGQIGDGTIADRTSPVSASSLTGVSKIYSSGGTVCALSTSGTLKCWGKNGVSLGSTGTNDNALSYVMVPTPVTGTLSLKTVTEVSMAKDHTCVVASGGVYCWGGNSQGVLGNGSVNPAPTPVQVTDIASGATKISTDYSSSCAVVSGNVKCWGDNYFGQLGNSSTTLSSDPVTVGSGFTTATDVIAGLSAYAVFGGTSVFQSWGANTYSQLYATTSAPTCSSYTCSMVPISPALLGAYTITGYGASKAEGSADVVCLILNGGVQCRGQASTFPGVGNSSGYVVTAGSNVTQVDASTKFSCAVVNSGADIKCWGDGTQGQLGNNTTGSSASPVAVTNILN